jgi:hypothetical protein
MQVLIAHVIKPCASLPAAKYFKCYPQVLQETISKIITIPSVIKLLEDICKTDKIQVVCSHIVGPEQISWVDNKSIHFNAVDIAKDCLTKEKKIFFLLYAINTGHKDKALESFLDVYKKEKNIDQLIENTEKITYLSYLNIKEQIRQGIDHGVLESTLNQSEFCDDAPVYSFDVFYVFQQTNKLVPKRVEYIKSILPHIKAEYKGTLGSINAENYPMVYKIAIYVCMYRWGETANERIYSAQQIERLKEIYKMSYSLQDKAMLKLMKKLLKCD